MLCFHCSVKFGVSPTEPVPSQVLFMLVIRALFTLVSFSMLTIFMKRYIVKIFFRLFSQHPTVNDELPNRILSGTVQVKPNIRKFHDSSVEFDDGSVVEDVDLVVGLFCLHNCLQPSQSTTDGQ